MKVAALVSGGLDSCVMLRDLAARGATVLPVYVRTGLLWEDAETYWLVALRLKAREEIVFGGGRYVDRFERRNGEWRIAVRNVVSEWTTTLESGDLMGEPYAEGIRDRTDTSYQRPLQALGALTTA